MKEEEYNFLRILLPEFWKQFRFFLRVRSILVLLVSLIFAVIEHSLVVYIVEHRWFAFVFAVLVVAFIFHAFGAFVEAVAITGKVFFGKTINVSKLEEASRDSGVVFYFSSLPTFSDWFRPELINYLMKTSPYLRDYQQYRSNSGYDNSISSATPIQHATRIFFIKAKELHHLQSNRNHRQTKCASELADIHKQLGIHTILLTYNDIAPIKGNCATFDFCLAFHDVNSIKEFFENKSRLSIGRDVNVIEPDSNTIAEVHGFREVPNEKKAPLIQFGIRVLEMIWDQKRTEYKPAYNLDRIATCHAPN